MDYKKAGVDIEAGYKSVELMKKHVKETMRPEVLGGLGGFAGAFDLSAIKNMDEPVLLSGTDGCGTKVKLAFIMDKHDTIGIDAVAMCVNDIACSGGEPLFFLDYIACGKNYPEKIATIVSGVAEGCKQSGCALVGGETAEHPGLMPEDDYDLAGFAVGDTFPHGNGIGGICTFRRDKGRAQSCPGQENTSRLVEAGGCPYPERNRGGFHHRQIFSGSRSYGHGAVLVRGRGSDGNPDLGEERFGRGRQGLGGKYPFL